MSIIGKIMNAIFDQAGTTPVDGGRPVSTNASTTSPSAAPAAPPRSIEIAPILDRAVAAKEEKLEWRTSIVDFMKALDIDTSRATRKQLATELGYTGDANDSASMNVWLHKEVMEKLAASGGRLPPEIKH
jgi:Domain of unknown function (DUF3597)